MLLLGCSTVITVVNKSKTKFLDDYRYLKSYNNLCKLFAYVAENKKRGVMESQYCSRTVELRTRPYS